MKYKPFLIQKLTTGASVRDSREWNIYVKSVPFKVFPDMKDVPANDWYDQNGDDEYIPSPPYYKAYEIDCEFVFVGENGTANAQIKSLLKYLSESVMFKFYDTHSKIGRTNVRYVSTDDDVLYRKDGRNDIVVFSVTLKVNDPLTDIVLSL